MGVAVDRGGRSPADARLADVTWLAAWHVIFQRSLMLWERRPGYLSSGSACKGWPMLALVLAAIGSYSMSLAPITWVILSEIFPNRIRGAAMAVSVSSLWIACFLLTITFPACRSSLGMAGVFWLYAAICVAGFFYILRRLPETKGKTLEEIEKELVD